MKKRRKTLLAVLLVLLLIGLNGCGQSSAVTDLENQATKLAEELESVKADLTQKESEVASLNEEKQALTESLSNLEGEKENLQTKLDDANKELELRDDWAKYVEPEKVIGKWETLSFIDSELDFDPSYVETGLWVKGLNFFETTVAFDIGDVPSGTSNWIDGQIYDEEHAEGFMIKEIDGVEYLFLQWMSNDRQNYSDIDYYVFKRSE